MKLFAGPFIGELGWELFGWQAYLRRLKRILGIDELWVSARSGHDVLYADFADRFIPFDPDSGKTHMWYCDDVKYDKLLAHIAFELLDFRWIDPYVENKKMGFLIYQEQDFVRYGKYDPSKAVDVLYHARNTNKMGTGWRNYPAQAWMEIIATLRKLYPGITIAAMGTKNAASCFQATIDLRDISLRHLVDVMASSQLLLGPSSGPMHLATLCGLPHIVWTNPKEGLRVVPRYRAAWNPFQTPCEILVDKNHAPPPELIVEKIGGMLK